jgi:hypothetical protein
MLRFSQTNQTEDVGTPSIASKFTKGRATSTLCGFAALMALMSATPASAQGVPAGLLRLDQPVASWDNGREFMEVDRPPAQARNAYARDRDRHSRHQPVAPRSPN